jgi:hypothetical protein
MIERKDIFIDGARECGRVGIEEFLEHQSVMS